MERPRDQPGDRSTLRASEVLPPGGQLVWVTPTGAVRELDPSATGVDGEACPGCGDEETAVAVVREHPTCGYVALDGLVAPASVDAAYICPKCATPASEPFPEVATVSCCLGCGHVIGAAPERR